MFTSLVCLVMAGTVFSKRTLFVHICTAVCPDWETRWLKS